MTNQPESGENFQDDIRFLITEPIFQDVTIVNAEGQQIRACRAFLAARCKFFQKKLYPQSGNPPQIVSLDEIPSRVLDIILTFIYTGTIDPVVSQENVVEVYSAAVDIGLPKVWRIIMQQPDWQNIDNLFVASSLLNKAVAGLPPSESNTEFYDVLLKPFHMFVLDIGQLNYLSKEALRLLLTRTRTPKTKFNTMEHTLLLSVIEWAWARDEEPPSIAKRHAVLRRLESATDPDIELQNVEIFLTDGLARASLQLMIYMDLVLICPHRLKLVEGVVNFLRDYSPVHVAVLHYACANTWCRPGHPSRTRGEPGISPNFVWDCSNIGADLVVSADGLVVEFPGSFGERTSRIARLSNLFSTATMEVHDINIAFESVGLGHDPYIHIGLINEDFRQFNSHLRHCTQYDFYSNDINHHLFAERHTSFGKSLRSGDIVTIRLSMPDRTCSLSINRISYGVAWCDFPEKVYVAVTICQSARCRIMPRV